METTETKIESMKEVLMVQELTESEIRSLNREYNSSVWDKTIDRIAKYKDVKFYVATGQKGYEYNRYYATYTIEEGITLFNEVGYSSSITNRGFCRITISPDGIVRRFLLKDKEGNEGYANNDKENRKILALNSKKYEAIFSNKF